MVRQAHHERLELPLVLSSSKDAFRSNRSEDEDGMQNTGGHVLRWAFEAKKRFGLAPLTAISRKQPLRELRASVVYFPH